MPTEDTPERRSEKPQTDHHFETPVVQEARPGGATPEERDDRLDQAERPTPPEPQMAFQHRWENVQTVFVTRCRRGLRPV